MRQGSSAIQPIRLLDASGKDCQAPGNIHFTESYALWPTGGKAMNCGTAVPPSGWRRAADRAADMRTRAILGAWLLVVGGVLVVKPAPLAATRSPGPVALASPARSPGTDAAPKPRDPG